jgi:hypothetical protein
MRKKENKQRGSRLFCRQMRLPIWKRSPGPRTFRSLGSCARQCGGQWRLNRSLPHKSEAPAVGVGALECVCVQPTKQGTTIGYQARGSNS